MSRIGLPELTGIGARKRHIGNRQRGIPRVVQRKRLCRPARPQDLSAERQAGDRGPRDRRAAIDSIDLGWLCISKPAALLNEAQRRSFRSRFATKEIMIFTKCTMLFFRTQAFYFMPRKLTPNTRCARQHLKDYNYSTDWEFSIRALAR
jgi:hypothetical protein